MHQGVKPNTIKSDFRASKTSYSFHFNESYERIKDYKDDRFC